MQKLENYFWRNETEYRSYYNIRFLGYLDLTCCTIVTISNIFVILIFLRKKNIPPINTIFIHIAIVEILTALVYIPRTWQELIRATLCSIQKHRTYVWEKIAYTAYVNAFMLRTMGAWMAVMLAVWRYIAIIHPFKERQWCNPKITRKFIILGYIFSAIVTIPLYFAIGSGPSRKLLDQDGCITSNYTTGKIVTIYEFQFPIEADLTLYAIMPAVYGVFIKLLPSVALAFISYRLINHLGEAKKQRKLIINQQSSQQTERTTKILVFILVLFIAGEVPHGIFCLFTSYYGPAFFWRYYYYGMEINNTITHISESFNFVIYYTMCDRFRKTFKKLFQRKNNHLSQLNITKPTSLQSPPTLSAT